MSQTEQNIIRKAASGDRMAFRQLVQEHSHAMFRLAWRMCGDASMADDIVQEAFIKAWRKLDKFRGDSSFRSWINSITVNTAMDQLRKRSRRNQFETQEPDWDGLQQASDAVGADEQIDISRQTAAAMKQLSDAERSALLLRHFEGHSINEIAQIMGITANACKQTIFRAVRKMRTELQPLVTT